MESEISIRPELRPAFEIFVKELRSHMEYFQKHLQELNSCAQDNESIHNLFTSARTTLEHRFHTIRGGSGFLGLSNIQKLAEQGEKMFRPSQGQYGTESIAIYQKIIEELQHAVEKK